MIAQSKYKGKGRRSARAFFARRMVPVLSMRSLVKKSQVVGISKGPLPESSLSKLWWTRWPQHEAASCVCLRCNTPLSSVINDTSQGHPVYTVSTTLFVRTLISCLLSSRQLVILAKTFPAKTSISATKATSDLTCSLGNPGTLLPPHTLSHSLAMVN